MSQSLDVTGHEFSQQLTALYSAASGEASWETFIVSYGARFPEAKIAIQIADDTTNTLHAVETTGWHAGSMDEYLSYYGQLNPWKPYMVGAEWSGVVWGQAVIDDASVLKSEFYTDWLSREDQAYRCFAARVACSQDRAIFLTNNFNPKYEERAQRRFDFLTELTPHLQRAIELDARLHSARDVGALYLDALVSGFLSPVFIFTGGGTLIVANGPGEDILRSGAMIRCQSGQLVFCDPELANAVNALRAEFGLISGPSDTKCLTLTSDKRYRVFAAPLLLGDQDRERSLLGDAERLSLILFLSPVTDTGPIPVAAIGDLFGLTPAEQHLLQSFAGGSSLKSWAVLRGISYNTARAHMSALQAKMGVSSQQALLVLVRNLVSLELGL